MKYNYKLMEEQIENLIKERGEIPKTCEITGYNDLIPKDMKQINKYYKEKYGKKCLEYYNDLGFEPNNCVYNPMLAKDGTRCNSTREAFIHNYLLDLNVDFEKEVLYSDILSDEKLKEQCGVKRLDWVVHMQNKDYYIEYFGLMGKYDYNKRHDLKIAWLKKDNKSNNFIAIYPKDLNKLDKLIKEKIKQEEIC